MDAYVDHRKKLLLPEGNTITDVETGKTRTWWDYELKEITSDIPNAGLG